MNIIHVLHLILDNVHDIVVTWSTKDNTEESIVEYGIGGLVLKAEGNSTLFVDGGKKKHKQYIHRVWLKNLTPDSKYCKILCFTIFLPINLMSSLITNISIYQCIIVVAVMDGQIYFMLRLHLRNRQIGRHK